MATDVELGAVKAYTIGAEETAVKNRIMLSRLRQAADIASSSGLAGKIKSRADHL